MGSWMASRLRGTAVRSMASTLRTRTSGPLTCATATLTPSQYASPTANGISARTTQRRTLRGVVSELVARRQVAQRRDLERQRDAGWRGRQRRRARRATYQRSRPELAEHVVAGQ